MTNKKRVLFSFSVILMVCPLLLSCKKTTGTNHEDMPYKAIEQADPDNNPTKQDIDALSKNNTGSSGSMDETVAVSPESLEMDNPEVSAYLDGGWHTWGFAGGEDVVAPRAYYEFKDGQVYEYCIPSLSTGEYSSCRIQPIKSIERVNSGYRIRVGDGRELNGYTLETSEQDVDILYYYGTWNENQFSENYSGTGSLERDKGSEYLEFTKSIKKVVESIGYPVSLIEPVSFALADHSDCVEPYRNLVEKAYADYLCEGYYLVDINGDDVPELLIYEGDSHAAGVHIYSWINNEIVDFGMYGGWGATQIDVEHHSICTGFTQGGTISESYFDISGSDVILRGKCEIFDKINEETNEFDTGFTVDGKDVSEKEYNAAVSLYSTGHYEEYGFTTYQMYGLTANDSLEPTEISIEKDDITDSLEVPKVNDGINYYVPDAISIHFNWNAIDGAEGYEVCEDTRYDDVSDDLYSNSQFSEYSDPQFSEVADHYYLTGGQDDFVHRIKVRAFKTEDGRRVFSEWSPYAIGKERNPIVGSSSITEGVYVYDKNSYIPVLDEYTKVFKGDETLYGMRAPGELYYKVNSFDDFDINDFYYAFCDYDLGNNDDVELLILKKKEGKDCLYSLLFEGLYSLPLDFITDSIQDDYSSTDLEPIQEGEELFLYDKGIIAKSRDEKDYSVRNYIRLVFEPDMVPFRWEIVTTVARITDSNGNSKYFKSDAHQSINYYPNEKKGLYEEISEDEFNKIKKEYEVPATIVKYPFVNYKGTP